MLEAARVIPDPHLQREPGFALSSRYDCGKSRRVAYARECDGPFQSDAAMSETSTLILQSSAEAGDTQVAEPRHRANANSLSTPL